MIFSFQGKVWLRERDSSGNFLKPIWVGNAPELTLTMNVENREKFESYSGDNLQIGDLSRRKTMGFNLTLDEWTINTLILALYGTHQQVAGSSVTDEAIPTPTAGDFIRLAHPFVSSLVLTDSADPTPQVLTLNTDYRIESANAGIIEILQTPGDPPVTGDYDYAAVDHITMLTTAPPERGLLLDGINTDNNEPVLLDVWRCKFNPVGNLSLITDDYGNIQLSGKALHDQSRATDSLLGGFGRTTQQQPA